MLTSMYQLKNIGATNIKSRVADDEKCNDYCIFLSTNMYENFWKENTWLLKFQKDYEVTTEQFAIHAM